MVSRFRTQRSSRCCSCLVQLSLRGEEKAHPAQGLQMQQQIERGKRLIYSMYTSGMVRPLHLYISVVATVMINIMHYQHLDDSDKPRSSQRSFLSGWYCARRHAGWSDDVILAVDNLVVSSNQTPQSQKCCMHRRFIPPVAVHVQNAASSSRTSLCTNEERHPARSG